MCAALFAPRRLWVARLVSERLSPPPIIVVLALLVAWDSSPTPGMAVAWGGIAAVLASLLPYVLILRGVRRGRLSDTNLSLRQERIRIGMVAITSILLGLAVLAAFDAPAELVVLLASITVGVTCGWVITLWWKISCTPPSPRGRHRAAAGLRPGAAGRMAPSGRDRLVAGPGG
jgi:hypothetical protein